MKLFKQIGLRDGTTKLVANVEDKPNLKVGHRVTLKDDPSGDQHRLWGIEWISPQLIEKYKLDRKFQVGGL